MIEQLFGSKTRVKLLQMFYSNPNRSFYVREITRKIDEQINSVRRELANLLSIGIITSDTENNNRLYYEVNQKYDYYDQLAAIFGGKGAGAASKAGKKAAPSDKPAEVPENDELKGLGHVDLAIMTGQFTRDETSGIDLLLVGDINPTQLTHYVANLEAKENKEIRYAVMKPDEFAYRRQVNDRFLSMVMSSKKQVLTDTQGVLEPAAKKSAK